MKRALIALLKLLLQLLIFALTGSWPRFADTPLEPQPARGMQKTTKKRPPSRPPLFQPVPAQRKRRGVSVYEALDSSLEAQYGREEGGVPMRRELALKVPPSRSAAEARPTLGSVLRSPRGLRDAIVLDAALGRRRARR